MPRRSSSTRKFNGKTFQIYDAFPTRAGAKRAAKDFRATGLGSSRIADLGKTAGRLRYAVFVRESRGR